MKILLDEQLPVKLKFRLLPEFEVSTVKDEKWLGIKNGELIKFMLQAGFEIFITNDQSLDFQQKLGYHKIIFINISKPSNRYEDILPVLLQIKSWLLKSESDMENILVSKTTWCIRLISNNCVSRSALSSKVFLKHNKPIKLFERLPKNDLRHMINRGLQPHAFAILVPKIGKAPITAPLPFTTVPQKPNYKTPVANRQFY